MSECQNDCIPFCKCEYHRLTDAVNQQLAPDAALDPITKLHVQKAIWMTYWSTHCSRCGVGIPFTTLNCDDIPVCTVCESIFKEAQL